jgi:hypothetical protein
MGMRYGVFNDGFILGREREEEKVYPIICSGETDMNRFGSHPNHENCSLYEGPLPHGLSEARRVGSFFEF